MRDSMFSKEVHILNGRCYKCDCEKDYGDNFPFDIERLPSDSDDYYKGYCKGMESMFDLAKRGDLVDTGIIYNEDFEDDCEDYDCFDEAFDNGYEVGFKKGIQVAHDEIEEDIYIDGYKIGKIDDIKHKVIALGSDKSDKVNEILKDLTELIKDEAMEAVNDYLGYR
ncbi:MAG: hypothetical protein IKW60_00500 [Clostridia bacterium]|nr:hypothetical protein [Clostridia bacterium]